MQTHSSLHDAGTLTVSREERHGRSYIEPQKYSAASLRINEYEWPDHIIAFGCNRNDHTTSPAQLTDDQQSYVVPKVPSVV